jgi:ATP-grasp enzyme of GAK system
MCRIGVVGNPDGWSSQHLADTVATLTGARILLDPAHLTLDLARGTVLVGDQDLAELDALILKKIGRGYRPEHLDRLEMLRVLADRGTRVFSDPERVLRVIDRLACTVTLARSGAPLPPTLVTEDVGRAAEAVHEWGCAVAKPLYTSKARGMAKISSGDDVEGRLLEFRDAGNHVIYLQKWMALPGRDLGMVFLGGHYVATYARTGVDGSWNTSVHGGGRYEVHEPSAELVELARRAQEPFGLDFTCVDVAETREGPVVWEVSAFGGFRGLYQANGIDAAALYARYVLERLG